MSDDADKLDAFLYALGAQPQPWQRELLRVARQDKIKRLVWPTRQGKSLAATMARDLALAEGRTVLVQTPAGLSRVRRLKFGRGTVDVHERIYSDKPDVKP